MADFQASAVRCEPTAGLHISQRRQCCPVKGRGPTARLKILPGDTRDFVALWLHTRGMKERYSYFQGDFLIGSSGGLVNHNLQAVWK